MSSRPPFSSHLSAEVTPSLSWQRPSVSWASLFAGLTAAIALQVLFVMLGAGLGFAIYSPLTDENPIADLGKGAVIIQGVSAVFSLWFGGWVAGRFAPLGARFAGWLHGFLVWCAATVVGVVIVSSGVSWALGDLAKLVGGGLSLAGRPASAAVQGVSELAKDALKRSGDTISSFVDEATGRVSVAADPTRNIRAKREIGLAAMRFFNPAGHSSSTENRTALVRALVDHAGMSESDADRAVTGWTSSFDRLKSDIAAAKQQAEAKAREAADKAADALAVLSLCAFVAFLLGAGAAACGGHIGAAVALKHSLPPETTA